MTPTTAISAALLAITAGSALAAPLPFTVDADASSASGSLTITAITDGTLIGDHDPTGNPTGTQTRPGLFGGSGNNPIPIDLDISAQTALDTNPAGSFSLDADTTALTFTTDAFSTDLLNGQSADSTLALELLYETFRTFDPGFLYLGGVPLPIDVEAGSLTTLAVTQSAPMDIPGALIPTEDPNTYTLAGVIPATLTISGTTFGDAPLDPDPTEITLPIAGTLTLNPDGSATTTLSIDLDEFSETIDTSTLPALPEIPFELPTLSEETAGVLLNLALTSLAAEGSGTLTLVANAAAAGCNPADIAEPYNVLDLADLTAFITAFTTQGNAADLDGNGLFDLADIQLYVAAFTAGCP